MEYGKTLMEHFEHPRNVGSLDENDDRVGTGVAGSPVCGDVLKLQIQVGADGRITDAKFKTFGCGASVASSSYTTELLVGKTLEEAETIRNSDIIEALSLPPLKRHCSVLTEEAIKSAVNDWKTKHGMEVTPVEHHDHHEQPANEEG
jgi:nitrogen fixation NifU-like protein